MLTIRTARREELPELYPLVERAVAAMTRGGNPQWDRDYPAPAHYAADQARGELYLAFTPSGALAGAACINTDEAPQYAPLPWSVPGRAVVIHRMAVDPTYQRHGVGRAFFAFAQELGRAWGAGSIRVDTYSLNAPMLALIRSLGYLPVGEVHFDRPGRPLPFLCFEKPLS